MRVLVQDFLRADAFFEFDPETGALSTAVAAAGARPCGVTMQLGEARATFFGHQGKLELRVGDDRVALRGDVAVKLTGEDLRKLAVHAGDLVVLRHAYPNPIDPPMDFDLGMAEEEDFDLGLFVANVAGSAERVAFLLERWS